MKEYLHIKQGLVGKLIIVILMTVGFISCHYDHLYYEMNLRTFVRLNIDWSKSGVKPNGASLYVYHRDGALFKQYPPISSPHQIEIEVPTGEYDLILHNDIADELPNLRFTNSATAEAFRIEALADNEADGSISKRFFKQPDKLAIGQLLQLQIPTDSVYHEYNRPQGPLETRVLTYQVVPRQIISEIQIIVHVKGLKYAAGAPLSSLDNLSDRYYLMRPGKEYGSAAHQFILNNRQFDPGSTENGRIMQVISSYGLQPDTTARYHLQMNFPLINGEKHPIKLDVTPRIEQLDSLTYRIELECELPKVVDPGGGGTGGGFDTDVEEWEDLEFDIPV